jgi:hypothetical protein
MVKNSLAKAGFKAPIIRRERIFIEVVKNEKGEI